MKKLYRPANPFMWVDPADPDTAVALNEGMIFDEDHPAVFHKPTCFVEVAPTVETPEVVPVRK